MAYPTLLIYLYREAVPTTVYSKPCAQGIGYAHVLLGVAGSYLGPHMRAMFSYSGDSADSAPQQDKISWSYLNTDKNYLVLSNLI